MEQLTIDIFKNVVFKLRDWYVEEKQIKKDEFNNINDFSVLKLLKLHFFVVAINSNENEILLGKNSFWAMPYGHVESVIYNAIRDNGDLDHFVVSRVQTLFIKETPPSIDPIYVKAIDDSIRKIRQIEHRLILADSGTLVDLTHLWGSWKKYYTLARMENKFSKEIPDIEIKRDNKLLNLDLV